MRLEDILSEIGQDLSGLECSAVVGTDGLILAKDVVSADIDVTALTVLFSAVFNSTLRAGKEIGDKGKLCSIHTLEKYHIVIQEIENTNYFVMVCLRTSNGNIGKARYILKKFENSFIEELK